MSADDDRYRSLEKVLQLEKLLEGKRYRPSQQELAAVLGVTRRTAVRYVNLLKRAGRFVPPVRPHACDGSSPRPEVPR